MVYRRQEKICQSTKCQQLVSWKHETFGQPRELEVRLQLHQEVERAAVVCQEVTGSRSAVPTHPESSLPTWGVHRVDERRSRLNAAPVRHNHNLITSSFSSAHHGIRLHVMFCYIRCKHFTFNEQIIHSFEKSSTNNCRPVMASGTRRKGNISEAR